MTLDLPPISLAKSDSLRSAGTALPLEVRAGGVTLRPFSWPHSRNSVTVPLAVAPLDKRRFRDTSPSNISTFSYNSSGCRSSIEVNSTSIPAPFLPIGRIRVVAKPAITLSIVSTSSLIGRRRAKSAPISTSPLADRPEKSPIRAMRNRVGFAPSGRGTSSMPNENVVSAMSFAFFQVCPTKIEPNCQMLRKRSAAITCGGAVICVSGQSPDKIIYTTGKFINLFDSFSSCHLVQLFQLLPGCLVIHSQAVALHQFLH